MAALFRRHDEEPLIEINTTPLIDVMLVLLIVLILAMPPMTHGTILDTPSGVVQAKRDAVTIDIEFDGSLYWNGSPVENLAALEGYLRTTGRQALQPDLRINANARAAYDTVAQVLALAQRNGIEHLGFVGQERFAD